MIPFDRPLSSTDLNYLSKKILKIPNYRGAFSKDKLPKKIWEGAESGIINLEDYDAGGGSHWCAYATRPNEHRPCYFDSFGDLAPPNSLKDYLGPGIMYNVKRVQNFDQVTCGHLCLYFLYRLGETGNYARTLDEFISY